MGKISRIQLRGISRTPSDRTTEDGGLAESLNVYIDSGETAPVVKPKDVTEELGIPTNITFDRLFIHKTSSYENYIFTSVAPEATNGEIYIGFISNGVASRIITLGEEESVNDITSIGNTLIVATNRNIHYILYDVDKYKYLGTQIPIPHVEFQTFRDQHSTSVEMYPQKDNAISRLDKITWDETLEELAKGNSTSSEAQEIISLQDSFWEAFNRTNGTIVKYQRSFQGPFFVRTAVRLFDGSYIYQSVPILIGAGQADTFILKAIAEYEPSSTEPDSSTVLARTQLEADIFTYMAKAQLKAWDISDWEDVIESLDIFVSTPIQSVITGSPFMKLTSEEYDEFTSINRVHFRPNEETEMSDIEISLTSASQFYFVRSFKTNALKRLSEGYTLFDGEELPTMDELLTRERLPDYEQSFSQLIPSSIQNINNGLIAISDKLILPTGYSFLNATSTHEGISSMPQYAVVYMVQGGDGELHKVVGRYYDGTPYFKTYQHTDDNYGFAYPYGLIFYPGNNCKEVRFWDDGRVYSIEMKAHPYLNCSYAYWGLDNKITDLVPQATGVSIQTFIANENREVVDRSKFYQSQINNPLYFPLSRNSTFGSKLIGLSTAYKALSEGQFGQYPLYVFTEEGIWVMETAADGRFINSKPLSREVCNNAHSIISIDQAVVFVTAKGVMMLRGSEILNISPNMNGKHYSVEGSAMSVINGQPGFCECGDVLSDTTPFMTFIKDARAAYDYPGKRLIFINPSEAYQYVYKLDTQTWHKTYHQHIKNMSYAINSYPECFVTGLYSDDRYMYYAGVQSSANSTEVLETLQPYLPNLTLQDVENYLNMAGGIDVTDLPEENAYPVYMYLMQEFNSSPISKVDDVIHLYDLSTHLDTSLEQQTEKGIIATRPFDMNEPDVLKTITDLRVRGQFAKGAVKFILQGSNDGIHFYTISTLRGKSWKMFRLIILADLAPTERISWVDVMYDSRFGNKLR